MTPPTDDEGDPADDDVNIMGEEDPGPFIFRGNPLKSRKEEGPAMATPSRAGSFDFLPRIPKKPEGPFFPRIP